MDDAVEESPPICEYCLRVFDDGDPIIECAECSQPICFCKTCFSYGIEGGEHRRGHNYRVHKQKTREIVKIDKKLGNWGFEDDMSLVVSTRLTKAANWPFLGEQIGFTGVPQALADHFDKYFIRGQIGQFARDFVELMRVICVEDSRWWTHFDFISDSLKFQVIVRSWMESSEEFDPFNVQAVIRNLFIFLQKKRLEFEAEKIDGKKKLKMKTMIGNLMATEQPKVEQRQPSKSITIKEELSIDVGHEPSDDSESFSPRRSTRQSKTKSSEKRSGLRDRSSRRSIVEESESPPPSTSKRARAKVELGKVGKDDDSPRRRRTSGVSTSSPGQPSPQINVDDDFQFVKPMMKEKRHEDTPSTPTIRSRKSSSVLKETIGPFDRLFIPCDCPNSISSPISFCVRCGWSPGNAPHPYEPLWYIIERDNQVYVINTDAKQREIRCKFVKDDQNSLRILADTFNEFPVNQKTISRQNSIQNGEKKKKKEKAEVKTVMLPVEERKAMALQLKVKPLKLVRKADGASTSWEPSPEVEIYEEELKPMQKLRLKKGASQRLDENLGKKGKITERRRTVEEIEEEEEEDEDDMEIDEKDVGDLITDIELPPVLEMMSPLRRRSSVRATSRDSSRRSEASHASKMEEDGMDDGEEENEDGAQPKRLRKMSRKMRESLYGSEENDEQNPEAPLSSPLSSPTANQSLPKLDPESSPLREKPSENACTELEKFLEENEECDDPYAHLLDNVGPGWESNASDGDDDTSACDEIKRGALTETSFDERTATRRDSTGSKRAHNEITSHELNGDYWKPVTANREERNGRRGNRTLSPQNSLTASRGDSFDDLEVGVIPQLNPETHPEERDSLLSSDDGESGDEMFARRMKIPYANFIDQQPPFSVENNSSGKRNLHILKAASGIRPHWSSAVIGPAFARMKIDDSNKQSVEKVLRAVDVLHGWKKDEQEPIDVLECLTKPAPFPGRQIFAHLLSDSQRAGQALTGIPLSYVVKDDEEEEIQTAIYEGESDGGLSEMVKKTKWSDAGKIPRGVVGIGYKHTTSGDVCEEIVYPGDDEQDILFASNSGDKHKKLKMRTNQVFVAGPQTGTNQKPIVWKVEKAEKEINQENREIDETRRALIGSLLDFEGDLHYDEILFRYLENEKPKVPQNYQLDFKMTLDKKLNQVLFKFDSGSKGSADLFEPSTSGEKVDEQPILGKSFANGYTPQKKPKKVLDESDDEETDSPPTKYRKTNSAKMAKTSHFAENSDSGDDFKEELLEKQSRKMTEKIREIVTQRMKSKNAKRRGKSSEIDDESEGMKESEDDSGSSDDESDTETKSSKKTPASTKKIKKKKKKALTKTERRLQIIQKKRENLIRQAEKERNRIYEVVGHGRDLSSMACGGLPRMARLQFTEPGKDACKGKQDEIDMLAYYPGRVDFELELHNEMEEIMSRTLFKDYSGEHDSVLDMENEIKMIRAQRFNRVLAERLAANRAIHMHGKNKEYLEFLKRVNQGRQKPSEIVAEKNGEEAILCVIQQVLKPEEIENLLEKRQKVQEMMAKVKALQELQKQGHLEYDKEAKEQVERAVESAKPKEKKRKYKKTKFTTIANKYKDKVKWNKMRQFYKT